MPISAMFHLPAGGMPALPACSEERRITHFSNSTNTNTDAATTTMRSQTVASMAVEFRAVLPGHHRTRTVEQR